MMNNLTAQLPKLCPFLAAISGARSCTHCNKVLITYLRMFTYNHSTLRAPIHTYIHTYIHVHDRLPIQELAQKMFYLGNIFKSLQLQETM